MAHSIRYIDKCIGHAPVSLQAVCAPSVKNYTTVLYWTVHCKEILLSIALDIHILYKPVNRISLYTYYISEYSIHVYSWCLTFKSRDYE